MEALPEELTPRGLILHDRRPDTSPLEIFPQNGNTCFICSQYFKHQVRLKPVKPNVQGTKRLSPNEDIKLVEIVTAHRQCRRLIKKRDKLLQELVEVEYDIFAKMVE